jgi:hypothetical protein
MIGDAFGALATLPLYCLGDLESLDPGAIVLDHYDIWHSCLVVSREVLRSDGWNAEHVSGLIDDLLSTTAQLRDAYLAIATARTQDRTSAKNAHLLLVASYERLHNGVQQLVSELELDDSILPSPQSLKRVSYERTLRWLGEELQSRVAAP